MIRAISFAHFVLILISNVAFNAAAKLSINYDYKEDKLLFYTIKQSFTLVCQMSDSSPSSSPLNWYKDGVKIEEVPSLKNRWSTDQISGTYKLLIKSSNVGDAGTYSCKTNNEEADINVISDPYVKLPDNSYVIEGEQLKLNCNVLYGGPHVPQVVWKVNEEQVNDSQGRIKLLKDNRNLDTILQIQSTEMSDRNYYTCMVSLRVNDNITRNNNATTFVRVKDKLAALWPFLGICAEVVILLVIIFIYEKKRDKSELVESDSEQNPEQKNYISDSTKESEVRQRK